MQEKRDKAKNPLRGLPPVWKCIEDDYELLKIQGQGSFGQVVKATMKAKKKTVAIKYIEDAFDSIYTAKRVYREIAILRRLSSMENNIFTCKLIDVIIPETEDRGQPCGIFLVMNHVN